MQATNSASSPSHGILGNKSKQLLDCSIDAALLGVEVYNKPRTQFRSQNFIVLMIIAWTRLFHAYFHETIGDVYYYKRKGEYDLADGERKAWELSTCIDKFGKLREPVETNLRLFIKLRNKIEHRMALASETDTLIFGECQSLLYNYESLLLELFGPDYALHESLAFSLQFSRLRTQEQSKANKAALSREAQDILDYITKYRDAMPQKVYDSQEYSVKLICVPRISNTNRHDLAIEFVKWQELDEGDKRKYAKLNAIIKERVIVKDKETYVVDHTSGSATSVPMMEASSEEKANATLVYKTLSEDIFNDVNKILQANQILSKSDKDFKFDQTIYYKVYANRDEFQPLEEQAKLLVNTGLRFYAPCLFWLGFLSDAVFAEVLTKFVEDPKFPSITTTLRISVLLGDSASDWIEGRLRRNRIHDSVDDKPLKTLQEMRTLATRDDVRLAAIRTKHSAEWTLPDKTTKIKVSEVLREPTKALAYLTEFCQKVANGQKDYRGICRLLDILAFGTETEKRGYKIIKHLCT